MKTVLVTGAGNGLGAAIAETLGARGWRVAVLDNNGDRALEVAARIENAVGVAADVTNEAEVEAAFEKIGDAPYGVVNNAGVVRFGSLVDIPLKDFTDVLNINLVGAFIVARAAARRMIARGDGGGIVNLTSINAIQPSVGIGAYPASKAALGHLTKHMAQEWGPLGIRVNSIAPGFIDAGMSAPIYADPEVRKVRGGGVPLRRLGTAADIAEAASYLLSDAANYITGHEIVVDGGLASGGLVQLPRTRS